MEEVIGSNRLRMFFRQNVHRVLIKNNFLRIIIKKYFYATTMRPRIHYTQQSSSWRRVARIVSANRMLRDRTLSIALIPAQSTNVKLQLVSKIPSQSI